MVDHASVTALNRDSVARIQARYGVTSSFACAAYIEYPSALAPLFLAPHLGSGSKRLCLDGQDLARGEEAEVEEQRDDGCG